MNLTESQIVAVITLIGSGILAIPSFLVLKSQITKTKTDTASALVDTAMDLNQPLRDRVAECEREIKKLKIIQQRFEEVYPCSLRLAAQLKSHDIKPVCQPPIYAEIPND